MKGNLTWIPKIDISLCILVISYSEKRSSCVALIAKRPRVRRKFTRFPCDDTQFSPWINVIKSVPSSEICTFAMSSVTMWRPLWRITPNNRTRFLWWRFLEKRILWICNKDTEQETEEEVLLRHDRRLFEEGLSGYVTFDVLNSDPLACVFPLEHSWNINISVRFTQTKRT